MFSFVYGEILEVLYRGEWDPVYGTKWHINGSAREEMYAQRDRARQELDQKVKNVAHLEAFVFFLATIILL